MVDDEQSDLTFIRKAFERGSLTHEVQEFGTGRAFLDYFSNAVEPNPPPDLILLDLSLPVMSGLDVLSEVRNGAVCPNVVIIVLTSSSYRVEVEEAYGTGANAFVTKPARLSELDDLVQLIENFWLGMAQLPYS